MAQLSVQHPVNQPTGFNNLSFIASADDPEDLGREISQTEGYASINTRTNCRRWHRLCTQRDSFLLLDGGGISFDASQGTIDLHPARHVARPWAELFIPGVQNLRALDNQNLER